MAKKTIAWEHRIQRKKNGEPYGSLLNAQLALKHDPAWKDVLAFDEFIGDIVTRKLPPWPKDARPAQFKTGVWSDIDTSRAAIWLAAHYDIRVDTRVVEQALYVVAYCNVVHPVREWLQSLKWDRTHRINLAFHRIAGSSDSQYAQEISKNFFIGAVARIMKPGCQLDSMPIFEGLQGTGKTSFFRTLFSEEWFLSTNIDITNKDAYQVLQRKWGVEMGELGILSRNQLEAVKQYVSTPVDTYRPSYARRSQDFPRQSVFAGTTNAEEYLKDGSGARRFWPLEVKGVKLPDGSFGVDLKLLASEREQLFAEALVRFKKGEAWHITDPKLRSDAALVAEEKRQRDPWEIIVARWIRLKKTSEGGRLYIAKGICTHDVLIRAFGGRADKMKFTRGDEMRAAAALRALGYTETQQIVRWGTKVRVYLKPGQIRVEEAPRNAEVVTFRASKKPKSQPSQPQTGVSKRRNSGDE
jgi:putative DNA primase/helicase